VYGAFAAAQVACLKANDGDKLLTVAIAPHQARRGDAMRTCTAHTRATAHAADAFLVRQVYGPRDMLFLHNILGAGNKVRIFGTVRPHTHTLEQHRPHAACMGMCARALSA
jgi:hypothetical protein